MTHTPDTLAPNRHAWAMGVVTAPCPQTSPRDRADAWAVLKEARGQTHRTWRLTGTHNPRGRARRVLDMAADQILGTVAAHARPDHKPDPAA